MSSHFRSALVGTLGISMAIVGSSIAQTQWKTFRSESEGFSIDAPGESRPSDKPGHYVYGAGDWSLFVQVDDVSPAVRELVENREREATRQFLARIGSGLVKSGNGT